MKTYELYINGSWFTKKLTLVKQYIAKHPHWVSDRKYEIRKDDDNVKYWVLPNQKIDKQISSNPKLIKKILDYTQDNNWVVKTYRLGEDYSITEYCEGYYPNVINDASTHLYDFEEYKERVYKHYYHFGNPYKKNYFNGEEISLPISKTFKKNREEFYFNAIKEHEKFSDITGCHFGDIDPNNFLVNKDYSDIKIIDVCCISIGHIKDTKEWVLPNNRIVGPVPSDNFIKKHYNESISYRV